MWRALTVSPKGAGRLDMYRLVGSCSCCYVYSEDRRSSRGRRGGGEEEGRVRVGRDRRGKEGGRRWRETEVEGDRGGGRQRWREKERIITMSSASHEVATLMQHTHHCTPHTLSIHTSVLQSKAR